MTPDIKRHLISFAMTFATGFVLGILPAINSLDAATINQSVIFGVILAGLRSGIKIAVEQLKASSDAAPQS